MGAAGEGEPERGCSRPECGEMESSPSGLAGLPADTVLLLRLEHPLNVRVFEVIGVSKKTLLKLSLRCKLVQRRDF